MPSRDSVRRPDDYLVRDYQPSAPERSLKSRGGNRRVMWLGYVFCLGLGFVGGALAWLRLADPIAQQARAELNGLKKRNSELTEAIAANKEASGVIQGRAQTLSLQLGDQTRIIDSSVASLERQLGLQPPREGDLKKRFEILSKSIADVQAKASQPLSDRGDDARKWKAVADRLLNMKGRIDTKPWTQSEIDEFRGILRAISEILVPINDPGVP